MTLPLRCDGLADAGTPRACSDNLLRARQRKSACGLVAAAAATARTRKRPNIAGASARPGGRLETILVSWERGSVWSDRRRSAPWRMKPTTVLILRRPRHLALPSRRMATRTDIARRPSFETP